MAKNLILGLILASLAQIWTAVGPPPPKKTLDIMLSYHHVQYQKKIIQSRENLVRDGTLTNKI